MSFNFDSSQIVKTYGKPRRTQKLGQVSVWHDDLTDDFDKCLGIEDVQQTTFISPERDDPVTLYKPEKHKKKLGNKTNTIGGWSMRLQSTLSGPKDNSISNKRNIDSSFDCNYSKILMLRSTEKKKDKNFKKMYSNCSSKLFLDNKNISIKSKAVTPTSIRKLNNKFKVSKQQCSTPLQKSMLFSHKKKNNIISSIKKKKKTKVKTNYAHTSNVINSSEMSKTSNNSHFNNYDSFVEINDKNNLLEESVQISSSHGLKLPNKAPSIVNNNLQNTIVNDHRTYRKPVSVKSKIPSNKKINNPRHYKNENSNWYSKVMDIFCDEKLNSFEESFNEEYIDKHIIEEIVTVKDNSENINNSNNSIYVSCYEIGEDEVTERSIFPNVIDIVTKDYKSVNNLKKKDYESSLPNQFDTSLSVNHSDHMTKNKVDLLSLNSSYDLNLNYSSKLCADSLDNRLSNILLRNTKQDTCANFNQPSIPSVENVGFHNSDCQFVPDSEIEISNMTNTFTDINIDDKNEQLDQFIIEEIVLNEFGESLNLTIDKSKLGDDFTSNNSSSISQSSSSIEQNCTVICLNNCSDVNEKKKNSNSNNELLNDENITCIENHGQYSSNKENSMCNDEVNLSSDDLFDSKKNLNTLNDVTSITNVLETSKSRQKRYASRFQNNFNFDTINESTNEVCNANQKYQEHSESIWLPQNTPGFHLEPGKKWRRSIIIVRNFIDRNFDQSTNFNQNVTKGRKWTSTVDDVMRQQFSNTSIHQSIIVRNSICRSSQRYSERNSIENEVAKKYILESCDEQKIISFELWLESKSKKNWKKVGEGVYGEVFMYKAERNDRVIKIIPIEGEMKINSERQKCMNEVYSEILIAKELNNLRGKNNWNQTNAFCKIESISCVQGKYPENLIKLWTQYDCVKGSDNDNPNILPDNQMFLIMEMENGGIDVESFVFNSATQALFAFLQIVFGLAVAEHQFNFEHRDLHIGNILVKKFRTRKISYTLDGEIFTVPSWGVKATVIDFTLSRMTYINKPIFNNLSDDTELFIADGDYQFEIYRLMKKETDDQWDSYRPKTNIFWLHYVLDKMLESVHYKNTKTIVHNNGLKNLQKLKNSILSFDSTKSFAESDLVLDLIS